MIVQSIPYSTFLSTNTAGKDTRCAAAVLAMVKNVVLSGGITVGLEQTAGIRHRRLSALRGSGALFLCHSPLYAFHSLQACIGVGRRARFAQPYTPIFVCKNGGQRL